MLLARAWSHVVQYIGLSQQLTTNNNQHALADPVPPGFAFSERWTALGPFQIGTRESPWSSDPLEIYGGFHALEYDPFQHFKSALAFNGTVTWRNFTSDLSWLGPSSAKTILAVDFLPSIDWPFLQDVFGWAGHQWLGWARSEIYVQSDSTKTLAFNTENIIEFWVDDVRYFGGDFYGYGRAAVTLHLTPGTHRLDIKLVGDVRSVGGIGNPVVNIELMLDESTEALSLLYYADNDVLMSDVVEGDYGSLVSPYATVAVRNDARRDIYVHWFQGMSNLCETELLIEGPIKLVPGQTRPIGFQLACVPSYNRRISLDLKYEIDGEENERALHVSTWPRVHHGTRMSHKMTYVHPSGVVSYAILRPPSLNASCGDDHDGPVPVMVGLHGAGTNADDQDTKHSMDPMPDICAWFIIPQGTTPWSGDDWHTWGFADVEAAVAAIPNWIESVNWQGPGVDIDTWFVSGHSNGGQGVWYALTHRPDKIFAAAAMSGYSSIQNYVPYTSWRTADPGRELIMQESLSSYRHDLLMDNVKDIPIIIQHGSKDDNVPAYHSRLMDLRIQEVGGDSIYFEIPDERHVWEGVATTKPLREFYKKHLEFNSTRDLSKFTTLRNFSMVVANPGDMGSKNGVKVLHLSLPGQLGKLDFTFDTATGFCVFECSNIADFSVPSRYRQCEKLWVGGQDLTGAMSPVESTRFVVKNDGEWVIWAEGESAQMAESRMRKGRQLGALDSVLRTEGAFKIVPHSEGTADIALQVSRNLCQYFAADTEITNDYEEALSSTANVISISIGVDMPESYRGYIRIDSGRHVLIKGHTYHKYSERGQGLAAIFLRPLPDERVELVVWGYDKASMEVAARLVPMMTGSGQPDFVVMDGSMMWKGLEGTLALGFLDSLWIPSWNAYFT